MQVNLSDEISISRLNKLSDGHYADRIDALRDVMRFQDAARAASYDPDIPQPPIVAAHNKLYSAMQKAIGEWRVAESNLKIGGYETTAEDVARLEKTADQHIKAYNDFEQNLRDTYLRSQGFEPLNPVQVRDANLQTNMSEEKPLLAKPQQKSAPIPNEPNRSTQNPTPSANDDAPANPAKTRSAFRLGKVNSEAIAGYGLAKGLLDLSQNGPNTVGTSLLASNATLLGIGKAEAFYSARAKELLTAAQEEVSMVKLAQAKKAAGMASDLQGVGQVGGKLLGGVGIGMDVAGAVNADNTISRVGHIANAGIGTAMMFAAEGSYIGPTGAIAGVVIGGAIEINEAWQEAPRYVNQQMKEMQGAKTDSRYLGNMVGVDAPKISAHIEEYTQLSRTSKDLGETDPAKLHALITKKIATLEASPGFKGGITSDSSAVQQVSALKSALVELGDPADAKGRFDDKHNIPTYSSRVLQGEELRKYDPERTDYLVNQLDRMNEQRSLQQASKLSPARQQMEATRDLIATHNEFALLQAMNPEDRKAYLQDNQAFLEKAGTAHYSPLAQTMLTYDNLLEKATSIGIKPRQLEEMGFGQEMADSRAHNTKRLQSVVQRLSGEGKLSVDNQGFFHANASLKDRATTNDRVEYAVVLGKMGIPAFITKGIASHLDGDILAAADPKTFTGSPEGAYKYIKGHTHNDAVKTAEANYLHDNPAAAQALANGVVKSGLEYFARFGVFKGESYGGITHENIKPDFGIDQSEKSLQREAQSIARHTVAALEEMHKKELAEQNESASLNQPKQDISKQCEDMFKAGKLGVATHSEFNKGKACIGIAHSAKDYDTLKNELKNRHIPFKEVGNIQLKSGLKSNDGGRQILI